MQTLRKFTKWDWIGLVSSILSFGGFVLGTLSSVNIRDDLDSRIDVLLEERGINQSLILEKLEKERGK